MIFLFNLVFFLGSMFIFQGESGGRSDHRGRILEERFEDFQWCHWNYTPLVLRYMFLWQEFELTVYFGVCIWVKTTQTLTSFWAKNSPEDMLIIRYLGWDDWSHHLMYPPGNDHISHLEQRKTIDSNVPSFWRGYVILRRRVTIHTNIHMMKLMVGSILAGPYSREWGKFHPQYTNVKVEGPSFPTTVRASQYFPQDFVSILLKLLWGHSGGA